MKAYGNIDGKQVLRATDSTPGPADFPLGSLASRAAARAKLESIPTEPPLVVHFVGDRGELLPSDEARVDEQTVLQCPSESQEDFEKRLLSMVPRGRTALIVMFSSVSQNEIDRDSPLS